MSAWTVAFESEGMVTTSGPLTAERLTAPELFRLSSVASSRPLTTERLTAPVRPRAATRPLTEEAWTGPPTPSMSSPPLTRLTSSTRAERGTVSV